MRKLLLMLLLWTLAVWALDDASALAQVRRHTRHVQTFVSDAVREEPEAPMVYTELGPIRGARRDGYLAFLKVPYVERPERYAISQPKKPWAPAILDASEVGYGCIGSHVPGVKESEDCLNINIWLPKGGLKNLPVFVYLHGGMNQHGAGMEPSRSGDMTVQSAKYPVIYLTIDFRMGIFGFYQDNTPDNSGVPLNLGFRDQQEALRWIQRNIPAFGGDPNRVALVGGSFGCPSVLSHMVAPGSARLFQRAVLVSPPVDMWARDTNKQRTEFILSQVGCKRRVGWSTLRCLKRKHAQNLFKGDFVSEDLTRNTSTNPKAWMSMAQLGKFSQFLKATRFQDIALRMGWHVVPDNDTMPGQPRDLIAEGRWNRVPVVITTSMNESLGVFPGAISGYLGEKIVSSILEGLVGESTLPSAQAEYTMSLSKHHIVLPNKLALFYAMLTDKVWACDIRSLARDLVTTGGDVRVGMFAHKPKYDPAGRSTREVCEHGATCHSSDMHYLSPQKDGVFFPTHKGMENDRDFASRYRDYFLAFLSGDTQGIPWKQYSVDEQPITFVDSHGVTVIPGYRKDQCDVLDRHTSSRFPPYYQRIKLHALESGKQEKANTMNKL